LDVTTNGLRRVKRFKEVARAIAGDESALHSQSRLTVALRPLYRLVTAGLSHSPESADPDISIYKQVKAEYKKMGLSLAFKPLSQHDTMPMAA
jgi:hypothetical protein